MIDFILQDLEIVEKLSFSNSIIAIGIFSEDTILVLDFRENGVGYPGIIFFLELLPYNFSHWHVGVQNVVEFGQKVVQRMVDVKFVNISYFIPVNT